MKSPARHVIAVGSGKGGVGKSTVALGLALALRAHGRVGVLDADFYGPDIPLMLGVSRTAWTKDWTLARRGGTPLPALERRGLKVMSAGLIVGEDQSLGLDAPSIELLMRQLVEQVEWGELDHLVVDLPPGTSAVQHVLLRVVKLSGAVIVVTPQDVAHLDARKAVTMFRHAKVPILGAVENMAGFRCPHCGELTDIFSEVATERSIWSMDVPKLGSLPFDRAFGGLADGNAAFDGIAQRIVAKL